MTSSTTKPQSHVIVIEALFVQSYSRGSYSWSAGGGLSGGRPDEARGGVTGHEERRAGGGERVTVGEREGGGQHQDKDRREESWKLQSTGLRVRML